MAELTDDELRAIARQASGTGYYSGGVKALRAVWNAGNLHGLDAAASEAFRRQSGYETGIDILALKDATPEPIRSSTKGDNRG